MASSTTVRFCFPNVWSLLTSLQIKSDELITRSKVLSKDARRWGAGNAARVPNQPTA